jgi:hypothetical protein
MTSIEWLENELKKIPFVNPKEVFEKAKQMHKEEMQTACHKMQIISKIDFDGNVYFMFSPKDYYDQTFKPCQ